MSCHHVGACFGHSRGRAVVQYADLGYNEVDGSVEWDNDYPNPITYIPPDQLTTNPGIVTTQFDNVLNAVRRCSWHHLTPSLGPAGVSMD